MQVLCNANRGTALTAKYLVGNTPETVFHVTIGREYPVFAVSVYRGATLLLLCDDNDRPHWYPMDLFSITDARVPADWYCAAYPETGDHLQLLLGYDVLISDGAHYDALLEREPSALAIFQEKVSREAAPAAPHKDE